MGALSGTLHPRAAGGAGFPETALHKAAANDEPSPWDRPRGTLINPLGITASALKAAWTSCHAPAARDGFSRLAVGEALTNTYQLHSTSRFSILVHMSTVHILSLP